MVLKATFPPEGSAGRQAMPFQTAALPFPLAVCYQRLQREMDAQQAVAAVWQMKDAMELGIRFSACVSLADLLQATTTDTDVARPLEVLFRHGGVSLGHWAGILRESLLPAAPPRLIPQLRDIFIVGSRRLPSPLFRRLTHEQSGFTHWRNRVFGHGVFRNKAVFYIDEVLAWLPVLQELYSALHQALAGWTLVDARGVCWQGSEESPPWDGHEHRAGDSAEELVLIRQADRSRLPLSPLLSIQPCLICHFPHTFFFDRNVYETKRLRHRTHFLDFDRGCENERVDLPQVRHLFHRVQDERFVWERTTFNQPDLDREEEILFPSFETDFRKPDYMFALVETWLQEDEPGYLELIGPEGFGKTWLVRGLVDRLRNGESELSAGLDIKVLPYFIRAGDRCDYRTFVSLLADEAKSSFTERTQEMQTNVTGVGQLAAQFCELLHHLGASGGYLILVILDGLDELPDPAPGEASIIDFLPPADRLPPYCQVLLTRRDKVSPHVATTLHELAAAGRFQSQRLDPARNENLGLIRHYLEDSLRETPQWVDAVLAHCRGVFLYAFHLVRAIQAGAFVTGELLPEGGRFYAAYLARVLDRVGGDLYEQTYLHILLLLATARQPVALSQLVAWGVCADRLRFALLDLRDFLREERQVSWYDTLAEGQHENRYAIAHDSFVRYLREDPALAARLAACHSRIAESTLARFREDWQAIDLTDDHHLYGLLHLLAHARAGDARAVLEELTATRNYGAACLSAARNAEVEKRKQLCLAFIEIAIDIFSAEGFSADPEALLLLAAALRLRARHSTHGRPELDLEDTERAEGITRAVLLLDPSRADEVRYLRGLILSRQGHGLRYLGRLREAMTAFRESLAELEPLPADMELFRARAFALNGLAITASWLDDRDEALAAYDRSIALYELSGQNGNAKAPSQRATVLRNKAITLRTLNRLAEAEAAVREAVAIGEAMAAETATRVEPLSAGLAARGELQLQRGQVTAALESFRQAAACRRMLMDLGRLRLSSVYYEYVANQGKCLRLLGRLEESLCLHEQVLAWRRKMHREHKYMPDPVAEALDSLAQARRERGDLAAALAPLTEAVAIRADLVARGYVQRTIKWAGSRGRQARLLCDLGEHDQAWAALDACFPVYAEYYRKGRYSVAEEYAHILLTRARLPEAGDPERCQADLARAREILAERWQGGSFLVAPDYIRVSAEAVAGLLAAERWQDAAGVVRDSCTCLDHVRDNLPAGDPEPLDRCRQAATGLVRLLRQCPPGHRQQLAACLDRQAPGLLARIDGWTVADAGT